jgi:hypothetical protein
MGMWSCCGPRDDRESIATIHRVQIAEVVDSGKVKPVVEIPVRGAQGARA